MPVPNPVRLFHITAIANLPQICAAGMLVSKNLGADVGIDIRILHTGVLKALGQYVRCLIHRAG